MNRNCKVMDLEKGEIKKGQTDVPFYKGFGF